eukprot:6157840-Pleurochrysis_carterae.AAC.2
MLFCDCSSVHRIVHLQEVLVEGRNTRYPSQVKGRNRQGCPIYFDGDSELLTGKLVGCCPVPEAHRVFAPMAGQARCID